LIATTGRLITVAGGRTAAGPALRLCRAGAIGAPPWMTGARASSCTAAVFSIDGATNPDCVNTAPETTVMAEGTLRFA
jgi:hypothetical protein